MATSWTLSGSAGGWYKGRAHPKGVEGWTSDRELLDTAQMERLRTLAAEMAGLPSQGVGTTFGAVNVYTEPNRQSTSFRRVAGTREVRCDRAPGRRNEPRCRASRTGSAKAENRKRPVKKEKAVSGVAPPPAPSAPAPPQDWVQLSKERAAAAVQEDDDSAPHAPIDDWTLIRTANGQGGWVLTSAIYLEIPDEVAQYAEGHRITSYFSIGKTRDGGQVKDIWLWTTSENLGEPYDFDGYRVFTWSLRRHRYETAYIQRREQGFFPVVAKEGQFSVCLMGKDGALVRKTIHDWMAMRCAGRARSPAINPLPSQTMRRRSKPS